MSSKTTDIYDYSKQNTVVGSNVSAGEIAISSKKDTNITGSNVVADNDVSVKAGGNLNIGSAEQTSESEYIKSVKKSGVFAGGGLGFTIGKEKQKDQYANQNVEQVGSTVGSVKGSVDLEAQKDTNIKGSSVVAGKDINITGENVSIENSNSVYNAQEKHEFKRTGLSVSVGGAYVDVVNNAANSVKHAADVEDKRLGALVAVKGYKDADKAIKNIKSNGGGKVNENLSINVSLGTTKSKSESNSTTTVANGSEVKAGGDVNVTSTKKDINITGSNVEGKDVTLNAKENLNITASKNTNKTEQSSKSSSASVGVGIGIDGTKYSVSGSMSKGEVSANGTSYNESNIKAEKDLTFASGNDTNIKGGKLSGEKVTGSVGGNLNIESKQDSNNYKESNKSVGVSVGLGSNKAVSGSASVGKIDSKYESVIEQSGIYAGKEGFEINVGENTDLKGGIISSEAEKEKNKISTGTLTYEDIQNKADYKAGSIGINVDTSKNAKKKDAGVTPNIGVGAKDNAESVTKATVSEGEIEIRDKGNQKQDLKDLNRDTQNSLNKLGEIFDKMKVEERQELAGLFGEIAYKAVGDLAIKKGWQEGSAEKNALHALVGGIMSELTNSGFLAGASGAMINEMIQDKLSDMFKDNPAMHQWASALIGGVVAQVAADNAQVGAATASSGTKNNFLTHEEIIKRNMKKEAIRQRKDLTEEEKRILIDEVDEYYKNLSRERTRLGKEGKMTGLGYEYGFDPDNDDNFMILPDDINAEIAGIKYYKEYHIKEINNNVYKSNTVKDIVYQIKNSGLKTGEVRTFGISGNGMSQSYAVVQVNSKDVYLVEIASVSGGASIMPIDFSVLQTNYTDANGQPLSSKAILEKVTGISQSYTLDLIIKLEVDFLGDGSVILSKGVSTNLGISHGIAYGKLLGKVEDIYQ